MVVARTGRSRGRSCSVLTVHRSTPHNGPACVRAAAHRERAGESEETDAEREGGSLHARKLRSSLRRGTTSDVGATRSCRGTGLHYGIRTTARCESTIEEQI